MSKEKGVSTTFIDGKPLMSEAYPQTFREHIVADILGTFTAEERETYHALINEVDTAFSATMEVYDPQTNTVSCTKEELHRLFDKYNAASIRLKHNPIAQAIINSPLSLKLEAYQEKLTQAYFEKAKQYGDDKPKNDISPRQIEVIAGDICQYEDQLLKELEANPWKYDGMTLDELIAQEYLNDDLTEKKDGLLFALLGTIEKPDEEAPTDESLLPMFSQLPLVRIRDKGIKSVEYPLDKINNNIWTSLLTADKNGQLTMFFDTMKQGEEPQPLVLYSIDFNALEDASIVKKLTAYDKRVYIAVNGLYAAGYDIISINQIYSVIANTKTKPNSKDREKINKSLSKMAARLHLDNTKEINETYAKYPLFKYDGALLPFDRIEADFNGNHADAIRIYRPASEGTSADRALPLVKFAKQRGQITTITSQVFGSLSLTDSNLAIEDYLIEQIGHIKKGSINPKMLYSTILAATNQTTGSQKTRAKEKIKALLDHFKNTGFIKDYATGPDGVTIIYERQKAIKGGKK